MWYVGPSRWPTARIWLAAAAVTLLFVALMLLGIGDTALQVIAGIVLSVVLVIAARNTLNRLGGPGALGKPEDRK